MTASSVGSRPQGRKDLLGAVLAGGESRRFGQEKALFLLAGQPMARWVAGALAPWTSRQVVMASDPGVPETLGMPGREDEIPGQGPLGGLTTALKWAAEMGSEGVFVLACDLPLVPAALVGRILSLWPPDALGVVPSSPGPLGWEPLCAGYDLRLLPVLEDRLRAGQRSMNEALAAARIHRVPMTSLGSRSGLAEIFRNINTREDAERAETILLGRRRSPASNGPGIDGGRSDGPRSQVDPSASSSPSG